MSSSSSDWFTRARHIFYGTATALVEILQDPEKRTENLNRLSMDLGQLAEELEQKGELTEQEAIRYLEGLKDAAANTPSTAPDSETPVSAPSPSEPVSSPTPTAPVAPTSTQTNKQTPISKEEIAELMELTHQIESLRLDLERLRTEPSSPPSDADPGKPSA
ncbi:MAG: hypothetical protein Q6M04_09790 [Thermostichus sp. BF3_bins_97]